MKIMIERFEGENGRARLEEVLAQQKLVAVDPALAGAIADVAVLHEVEAGHTIIVQGASDDDVFLILSGAFDIVVNGHAVARRRPGDHVGEMAAIEPSQTRSATVVAAERSVVARLTRDGFVDLATRFPNVWRVVAKELARRLMQRNDLLTRTRERPRVFVMSSTESLPIARAVQSAFEHDHVTVEVWTDGVFTASSYPIESLERELDESDFAIAVAAADDVVATRDEKWPVTRDNVTFELGFFMGRLGRKRTLLLEPRGEHVKLPSDLAGLTTIAYKWSPGRDAAAGLGPTCTKLRAIFEDLGPRT
jgi:predicted nucleotide-binding protein